MCRDINLLLFCFYLFIYFIFSNEHVSVTVSFHSADFSPVTLCKCVLPALSLNALMQAFRLLL